MKSHVKFNSLSMRSYQNNEDRVFYCLKKNVFLKHHKNKNNEQDYNSD